ncbi:MAG TPA: peptidyl-prolyl cis-trans isomerase, partial [Novosphingobium sp.]|nr:peptidyl-prolyl cis-trans isomerase [Novosphingobium sp.]
ELAKLPVFQGADGKFSDTAYRQFLAQRQLTDQDVRADLSQGLVAKMVIAPAEMGGTMPAAVIERYAAMLKEHRAGTIAVLPSPAFAPKTPAGDAEIAAWYGAHKAAYTLPERRVIRVVRFDESVVKNAAAPTDAEIAARYNLNKAQYAASETRKLTQLIVNGEDAAKAIAAEVAKGTSLDSAAKAKGLSTAVIGPIAKEALASQGSPALADAAFAAKQGAIVGPVKTLIGWAVVRVDAVEVHAARSLDQAKGEIAAQIATEKRRAALSALTGKIDERFGKGGALSDEAKDLGLTITELPALTADGQVYGQPGKTAPADLSKVVQAAFGMEHEGQAQIAELVPGKQFVLFDVHAITPAAPAPLPMVKARIAMDIAMTKGDAGAKAAAQKVLATVKKGADLKAALAGLGVALPPVQDINMGRDQLAAQQGQIPPALALFFGMAPGTTKLMAAPGGRGWFVVHLNTITPGTLAANDPMRADVAKELGQLSGREYADSLRRAIRAEVGVKRNEAAIKAVAAQLGGTAAPAN